MNKSLRPDQPIRSSEEDALRRAHLAKAIGQCILATNTPESITIAINAPWGAGKSSFLNLLEQRLKSPEEDEVEPILIRLNPWLYNSVKQIIEMSFGEFKRQVGSDEKARTEIADEWRPVAELLREMGIIFSEPLAVVTGSAIKLYMLLSMKPSKNKRELSQLKDEINKRLEQLKRRVIVFIDDIDRLERDSLRLLFRAIRLCADFKNVTYVLAFDKSTVEKHLAENDHISEHDHSGRDYLEKIVQVSFDLPDPEPNELARFCFKEIEAVLNSLSTQWIDGGRLRHVFYGTGFKDHFQTIRQIKRYVNGLRLTLVPVAAEVDPVDFVVIDFLRTFYPKIYSEIAQRQDMLALVPSEDTQHVKQVSDWKEELCSNLPPDSQECVQRLLSALTFTVHSDSPEQSTTKAFSEERRVCSPAAFDKFFRLAAPSDQISEVKMDQFVENLELKDESKMFKFIKQALSDGKTKNLFARLERLSKRRRLREECIVSLIKVMFRCVDNPDIEEEQASGYDINSEFVSIIYYTLLQIESEDKRYKLILELIQENPAPYAIVKLVSVFREIKLKDESAFPIRDDEETAKRIQAANHDESLWRISDSRLYDILIEWVKLASEDELCPAIISWFDREKDDGKFIAFLESFEQYLNRYPDHPKFETLFANNEIKARRMKIRQNNEK